MSITFAKHPLNSFGHIQHLEDLLFQSPHTQDVYKVCRDITTCVVGGRDDDCSLMVKYDGAPSLLFGMDDGEFFVATKSVFNRVAPVMVKSFRDAQFYYENGGLTTILWSAYQHLSNIYPKRDNNIYQGDLLFLRGTAHAPYITEYNTRDMGVMQPNAIMYGVSSNHALYAQYERSGIGLAMHTTWKNVNGVHHAYPMDDGTFAYLNHKKDKVMLLNTRLKMPERPHHNYRGAYHDIFFHLNNMTNVSTVHRWVSGDVLKSVIRSLRGEMLDVDTFPAYVCSFVNTTYHPDTQILLKDAYSDIRMWAAEYNTIIMFKNAILTVLLQELANDPTQLSPMLQVNGRLMPTGHEGIVATLSDGLQVKLVNRKIFTYINDNSPKDWKR